MEKSNEQIISELRNVNIERDILRLDLAAKKQEFGSSSIEYLASLSTYNKYWDTLTHKKYSLLKELVDRGHDEYLNAFNEISEIINYKHVEG
ncbi:hypothetical protein [Bacillus litorisediminis]|uniref:hypothetical protein n=1 Tax=Bacillus litorisediminis TaxID=2922713 RepID=UPI001FAEFA40|nr:hypothetical protein [Bacillus litorisediminis]